MAIIVPEYERRVTLQAPRAARPATSGPNAAAFENKSADIMANAVSQMGSQWAAAAQKAQERKEKREKAKRLSDIMLGWEKDNNELLNGQLDEKGNQIQEGLLATRLENAANAAKTYYTKGEELKKKYLAMAKTQDEYDYLNTSLSRSFQENYDRTVRHQLREERESANHAANAYFALASGQAGSITSPQAMRAHLDGVYQISDENARGQGLTDEETSARRYIQANANMTAAVQGAVFNQNLPAARKLLDGLKSDMLPDDWNRLNNFIAKAGTTQQKASESEQVSPLYERALKMAENNPETLQEEIVSLMRNPSSALGAYSEKYGPLKGKQLLEYANWVQRNLLDSDDTRSGQIKAENWRLHENGFNAFEWKKNQDGSYKIGNKEMRTPQSVLSAIGALQGHIDHHDFAKDEMKKAQTQLSQLRTALGQMDIKADGTALGEVVRQANLLSGGTTRRVETGEVARRPVVIDGMGTGVVREMKLYDTYNVGGFLSPEEKSLIIEQTAQFLQASKVNLLAKDRATKQAAVAAAQAVARDYVRSKFGIVRDDVMDVQVGDNTFKSYGIKPNPNLGAAISSNLDGYRYEEQNGVAYLIKRDKRGNELHRQLL